MKKIVDLSHHQGDIDFSKAHKEIDLAIIRVQYGSTTIDKKYKEYVAECKKYKIPFGHYAYAKFISVTDAKKEAEDFLLRIDKEAKFLVVDVEEQTTKNVSDVVPSTQAFIDVCKKAGYKVGLYTGHHFYKPFSMEKVKADFVWIPRYGDKKPDYNCQLWQYTDKGKIDGISGYVDLNQLIGVDLGFFIGNPPIQQEPIEFIKTESANGSMKLELTNTQRDALEYVLTTARLDGFLNDESWEVKVRNGELTISEAIYLSILIDHRRFKMQTT